MTLHQTAVDPAYRNDVNGNPTAKFYFNDAQLKGLRSVTDAYGRPLLVDPSDGRPPTLYGYPCIIDNNLPNLTASTTGGPIFGDLSRAMVFRVVRDDAAIITDLHPTTMRLVERYADYLQIGYLGYMRVDMRSNDMRAAVTVKANST